MNENKKFSISNMMLAFITVLVVIGLVALAGFFLLTPPDNICLLYTSPSPRDRQKSRMPSSA